jgi:hypothetical protein
MAVIGIAPSPGMAGFARLKSVKLGLLRHRPVMFVHPPADFAADDAADHGAGDGCENLPGPMADLIAEDASRQRADRKPRILIVWSAWTARRKHAGHSGENDEARSAHDVPLPDSRAA